MQLNRWQAWMRRLAVDLESFSGSARLASFTKVQHRASVVANGIVASSAMSRFSEKPYALHVEAVIGSPEHVHSSGPIRFVFVGAMGGFNDRRIRLSSRP